MAEAAAHLVDNVLPLVPYRQFVVSFPIPLRYWMQFNKKLYSKIQKIVINEIHEYYIKKALHQGIKDPRPGSISFSQRWGSALNLNPHMHLLCIDGVYATLNDGSPRFKNLSSITDEDTAELLTKISARVLKYLRKKEYLDRNSEIVENPAIDHMFQENESISIATTASIAGKIAFGPNAGKYVTKIGSGFGYGEEIPLVKGRLCFSVNGFSLHAATATKTHQRDRLENLIEYISRGPLSNERLEITSSGQVKLQLKTRWSDGTSHLLFTPTEFIEKLTALIPPPKSHLVRWSGVFAPNAPLRKQITLKPEVKKAFQFKDSESNKKNYSWSKMLARVFKIDVMKCEYCSTDMKVVAAILNQESIKKYLQNERIEYEPPPRAPPRSVLQGTLYLEEQIENVTEDTPTILAM